MIFFRGKEMSINVIKVETFSSTEGETIQEQAHLPSSLSTCSNRCPCKGSARSERCLYGKGCLSDSTKVLWDSSDREKTMRDVITTFSCYNQSTVAGISPNYSSLYSTGRHTTTKTRAHTQTSTNISTFQHAQTQAYATNIKKEKATTS